MENNIFVFTDKREPLVFERFHICIWEFKNESGLIELGGEISKPFEIDENELEIKICIPWIDSSHEIVDLYDKLKESDNSRFIFNDSVTGTEILDDGQQRKGVIQKFAHKSPLCITPIESSIDGENKLVKIRINLKPLKDKKKAVDSEKTGLYFRFFIEPDINHLSTRKAGINRSTIIYDIKVNEKRNFPEDIKIGVNEVGLCEIETCFFFNILPNSYDLSFFDSSSLKNIRTLEFDSFKKYLGDNRVARNELVVVFNKKKEKEGYSFFSIFSKERIGAGHFALAVLVNLICGILLYFPNFRKDCKASLFSIELWKNLPFEVYLSIIIGIFVLGYFFWPKIKEFKRYIFK